MPCHRRHVRTSSQSFLSPLNLKERETCEFCPESRALACACLPMIDMIDDRDDTVQVYYLRPVTRSRSRSWRCSYRTLGSTLTVLSHSTFSSRFRESEACLLELGWPRPCVPSFIAIATQLGRAQTWKSSPKRVPWYACSGATPIYSELHYKSTNLQSKLLPYNPHCTPFRST